MLSLVNSVVITIRIIDSSIDQTVSILISRINNNYGYKNDYNGHWNPKTTDFIATTPLTVITTFIMFHVEGLKNMTVIYTS